jgi:hypothetical protein
VVQNPETIAGQLKTAASALQYILAGNAYFTLRSAVSGIRYTFRVSKPKEFSTLAFNKKTGTKSDVRFVSLLAGPENNDDYVYLGIIEKGAFRLTKASSMLPDSVPVKAITWTIRQLSKGTLPPALEIWHSGRCGRCGRMLTVPESIADGIGPECASKMGL